MADTPPLTTCAECHLEWRGPYTDCPGCQAQAGMKGISDLGVRVETLILERESWRRVSERLEREKIAADARADALAKELDEVKGELQGGHQRLNECSGWEATKGLPLYERISKKIEQLSWEKREADHMRQAVGHEMDILRSRAEAAEHRRAAAEYRAQRIVLDAEL